MSLSPSLTIPLPAFPVRAAPETPVDTTAQKLTKLSSRGVLRVAETSGHFMQLDQLELVVEAIHQVIEATQQKQETKHSRTQG